LLRSLRPACNLSTENEVHNNLCHTLQYMEGAYQAGDQCQYLCELRDNPADWKHISCNGTKGPGPLFQGLAKAWFGPFAPWDTYPSPNSTTMGDFLVVNCYGSHGDSRLLWRCVRNSISLIPPQEEIHLFLAKMDLEAAYAKNRTVCHHMDYASCRRAGCEWDDTFWERGEHIPLCYHRQSAVSLLPFMQALRSNDCCTYPYCSADDCIRRQECQWLATPRPRVPWCFFGQDLPASISHKGLFA